LAFSLDFLQRPERPLLPGSLRYQFLRKLAVKWYLLL
jgi:hypothetical protein